MASKFSPAYLDPGIQLFANELRIPSVLRRLLIYVIPVLTRNPTVTYLMINAVFASMLVPMLVALFYFSAPGTRTSPVFICAVGTIFFGALQGITIAGSTVRAYPSNICITSKR
jgi:hypothetical protein